MITTSTLEAMSWEKHDKKVPGWWLITFGRVSFTVTVPPGKDNSQIDIDVSMNQNFLCQPTGTSRLRSSLEL